MVIESEIHLENWKKTPSFKVAISETKTSLLIYPQAPLNQTRNTYLFQLNILPSSHWNCDGRLLCVNCSYHPGNPLTFPWWAEPVTKWMWMSNIPIVFAPLAQTFLRN